MGNIYRLENEQLSLECYGLRIYKHICAECGKDKMSEVEDTFHEIRCGSCGCKTIRLIRDKELEEYLLLKGKITVQ